MHILQSRLLDIVKNSYPEQDIAKLLTFASPPKPELGDIALGVFWLSKTFGVNPIELAIQLAGLIRQSPGIVSANATGGYVNVKFDDASLVELLGSCGLPVCHFYEVQPVAVVDYFGANVGKPLHIGHLCAPSIGQAIINAFRHKGYRVIGDMHQGDWGSLFGKLAIGYRRFGSAEALEADATEHLFEVYVKLTAAEASDPSIAEEYREAFQKLSRGDPEMVALWLSFTQKTIHTALELGKRLLVFPDVMIGEAFYEGIGLPTLGNYPELRTSMSEVVAELIQLGIATENEDGSVGVIFDESTKIPSCMLAKRDGTHGYLASDLACVKYRITNGWNPEHIVYCMDVRQELHVRQIFEVARLWIERSEWGKSIAIVPQCFLAKNGFLKLKDGAMSTRKGNIIRLGALMDEGISRVDALLKEKWVALDVKNTEAIAIGAIKYSYLMSDREKDIVFDWDKALNFEGHSGPYIQYSYVRAKNILEKSGWKAGIALSEAPALGQYDRQLISMLAKKEEAIDSMLAGYKPHHLAIYAYDLATTFSSFYVHTPKLLDEPDADLKNIRLEMVERTLRTIEEVFDILAIPLPERM